MANRRNNNRDRQEDEQVDEELTPEQQMAITIQEWFDRSHYTPIWVDTVFLRDSGLEEIVTEMLTRSGWRGLLDLDCDEDKNDTSEFLATYHYVGLQDHGGFSYRYRGVQRVCTMEALRGVFGWPAGGTIYLPRLKNWAETWRGLSSATYKPSNNSAKGLNEPALYYLHHIIGKTLLARKNADKVGKFEVAILHMLRTGMRVHWGHYFCKHVENLRKNSPICIGGMITYLLRQLHPDPVPDDHVFVTRAYADRVWFQFGQSIQVTHQGEIQWCYFTDPARRPPPVPPRPRGRPSTRPRGGEMQVYERGESSRSQQQHAPPPPTLRAGN